ncbi:MULTISPECIES: ATP-binding SpoIIE family protein phosphatase [unclassified Streptomyces]|uniref:ATP-binding SpoIIE family protein phosphatase n=1 Tax=unclassified Streptomyces TaxID=2593676 RepID=UPI0015E1650E|nr:MULTISPECIES: ATP-binding SpoIIE family protein phosphatase [unclassified Streptomyces]
MKLTRWGIRLPGAQRRATSAALPAAKPVPAARESRPGRRDTRTTSGAEHVEEKNQLGETAGPDGTADGAHDGDHPAGVTGGDHGGSGGAPTAFVHGPAVHELLGQVPAPVALVHGADHRVAYVNDAYATLFGPRTPGTPARESLTELAELGLVPLMDQVRRSNTSRTVKSRRVPGAQRDTFHTFTCAPVELSVPDGPPVRGVLVFAADVTDQVTSAERLRESEGQQRATAVTLQRSLLPQELEQPDELRVAATYRPGGTEAAVGGDWYDVITLGAGRTALVIGDVMGRGVRAAAVMGQLRTAVRAYARLDLPPNEVVQLLDGLASEIDASQIATCVYAVHDPSEDTLSYASAGHLPIIVRRPDGTVHRTEGPTGPPLGTGGWGHESAAIPFPPGSTAVLCTDGLVERRDADIDHGLDVMEEALAAAADSPQILCDRLLRALGITDGHDDDVAVLAFVRPEPEGEDAGLFRAAALDLHGGIEATPRARAFAGGVLSSWRFSDELRDLGVLTASELVANSVVHGKAPMRLRLRRTDRRLIIEVTDGDEHLPRRQQVQLGDETGRGIALVAAVATDWGTRRLPDGGKSVWAEFALPADG